jgi:hypothetical protein
MPNRRFAVALLSVLALCLAGSRPEASARASTASLDETAIRELLEGKKGRREAWNSAPALVIVTSVMDYTGSDLPGGYATLDTHLTEDEVTALAADLTHALDELTDGTFKAFRTITIESPDTGTIANVVRPGQIVAGRFVGVQARTGSLGYGGRLTHDATIVGATVMLDAAFDRDSDRRRLLRTHELGHALGYNHVESRPSVMNPRVGSSITEFDRMAIRRAFSASSRF